MYVSVIATMIDAIVIHTRQIWRVKDRKYISASFLRHMFVHWKHSALFLLLHFMLISSVWESVSFSKPNLKTKLKAHFWSRVHLIGIESRRQPDALSKRGFRLVGGRLGKRQDERKKLLKPASSFSVHRTTKLA